MAKSRFLIANVASALVWAPTHVFPAQFAGLSIGHLDEGDWKTAALWGGALLAAAIGLFALHRLGPHGLKALGLLLARPTHGVAGGRTTGRTNEKTFLPHRKE